MTPPVARLDMEIGSLDPAAYDERIDQLDCYSLDRVDLSGYRGLIITGLVDQEYLLCHGLSVEMTEALAELWHRRIREEWGFADEDGPTLTGLFRQQYRGSRYSWGYPACPDLDDQTKVAELLEIDRIGVALTEEFHLVPEQSTSAIVVPHPEAKYFVV